MAGERIAVLKQEIDPEGDHMYPHTKREKRGSIPFGISAEKVPRSSNSEELLIPGRERWQSGSLTMTESLVGELGRA